jgi:hypothetical protein
MSTERSKVKLAKRERKDSERSLLLLRIERSGIEMAPCTTCVRTKQRYVVDSKESSRCSKCVRRRRPRCDYTNKLPTARD